MNRVRGGMSPSLNKTGRADPDSEQRLLTRVRRGNASAVAALFARTHRCGPCYLRGDRALVTG